MGSKSEHESEWTVADAIIKSLPGVFYLYDDTMALVRWNEELERISGFSKEELTGKSAYAWLLEEDRPKMEELLADAARTGEAVEIKLPVVVKNGVRYFHMTGIFTVIEGRRYLIGVGNDITEAKALEEQLAHVRRMEVLGGFATGVAHDFNNILSSVMGFNSLLRLRMKDDDVAKEYSDSISRAVKKGKNLVEQILSFSNDKGFNKKNVVLSDVVRNVLSMQRGNASCVVRISDKLESKSIVLADPDYLRRVVVNLVSSAVKMAESREGARVEVVSRDIEVEDEALALISGMPTGNYAVLEVKNNGEGVDRKNLDRIFDPYFSAVVGRGGAGLGLAVTRDIVERHNGFIACRGDLMDGIVFSVCFPAIDEDGGGVVDCLADSERSLKGEGGVMFVDDEDSIVKFMRAALQQHGYDPLVFTDPFAALEAFEKRLDDVRILVLDVRMPGMSGVELARRAREMKSDIPVVLCSGNADLKNMDLDLEVAAKIGKPFSISQVMRIVAEVLESRDGSDAGG